MAIQSNAQRKRRRQKGRTTSERPAVKLGVGDNEPAEQKRGSKRNRGNRSAKTSQDVQSADVPIWQQPITLVLMGGALLWLSFPPIGLWPLAWLAPAPWIALAMQPELKGRRPWLQIWVGGWVFWLAMMYYLRLPHWLLNFGWPIMSAYLCCFAAMFFGVARFAIHQWKLSPMLAVPVAWAGSEFLRSTLFGGLGLNLLSHTQVPLPVLIQTADLFGGYGVSFLMILATTGVVMTVRSYRDVNAEKKAWWPAAVSTGVVAIMFAYGSFRMAEPTEDPDQPATTVALIQGTIDTTFPKTDAEADQIKEDTFDQYMSLTHQVLEANDVDLVVWPEGKFTAGPDMVPPSNLDALPAEDRDGLLEHCEAVQWAAQVVARHPSTLDPPPAADKIRQVPHLLVGCSTWKTETNQVYNSALLFDPDGELSQRYLKNHRVMFGEYVPFGDWFPVIYDALPIGMGLTPGTEPVSVEIGEYRFSPSVCFESTVPHFMRRQLGELADQGERVDVMLNLTDDGWFWGSAALDHHLACNIFRTVELRRPMLIAANTGISANIDSNGVVQQRGGKRVPATFVCEMRPTARSSIYEVIGDWPATGCLAFCLIVGLVAGFRWLKPGPEPSSQTE